MTLKIGWLHEAENHLGTWLHEADDWQRHKDLNFRLGLSATHFRDERRRDRLLLSMVGWSS